MKHLFSKTNILPLLLICLLLFGCISLFAENSNDIPQYPGYELVWSDEFDIDGVPNPDIWRFEKGFARNEELQWYQADNTYCENGLAKIEGRVERVKNPNYQAGSSDWKKNREYAEYTSSSMITENSKNWLYGRFEISAKIPTAKGSWPAIWLLGIDKEWPSNGEIDIMEFYLKGGAPHIMANAAWGSDQRWVAKWDGSSHAYTSFTATDPDWADKFHLWRMDWDKDFIRIYLDGRLLNEIDLNETRNPDGFNPFRQPQYILLNLALGSNGGTPDQSKFPLVYEIDYVRVYQKIPSYENPVKNPEEGQKYYLKHLGNTFLTVGNDGKSSHLKEPTGNANQQYRFIPVNGQKGKYYMQQVSSGLYLYNNSGNLGLTENYTDVSPANDAVFEVLPLEGEKYVRVKLNTGYLATDEYEDGAIVSTNKGNATHPSRFWELLLCTSDVGKIGLVNLIDETKEFLSTAIRGTSPGSYPADKYDELISTLSEAEQITKKSDAAQTEVDEMLSDLQGALLSCKESIILLASDPEKMYNIIHSSGNYLGTKGTNAGIATADGSTNQQFKFVPVGGESDVYNIQQVSTNKYLGRNQWNTVWNSTAESEFRLDVGSGNTIRIKYTETNKYLGTDDNSDGSFVYSDKDGSSDKHTWLLKIVGERDFSALDLALSKALLQKTFTTLIGNNRGECPQGTYDAFAQKITEIDNLDRISMSEDDIAAKANELNTAINTFVDVLRAELTDSVSNAEALYDVSVAGNRKGEYPLAAKNAFGKALNIIKQTLNNTTSYQADFNLAVEKLAEAADTFRKSVNTEDVPDSNDEINQPEIAIYTSANTLHIDGLQGNNKISVFNSLGALVYTESTSSTVFNKNLSSGLYIISITGNVNHNQKVIIQ